MSALAADLAAALDPVALARRSGLEPDPWQVEALRSEDPRLAFNVHRQGGKSTVAALKAVQRAVFRPPSFVVMLAPSLRQSQELYRKALAIYRSVGRDVASSDVENRLSFELANGSRVLALPGTADTIRGFSSVDLAVADEAARIEDEAMAALRPMLAVSSGQLLAMSTPAGKRGWWYEAVTGGTAEAWQVFTVRASECARLKPSFLEAERVALGPWWFGQEYQCSFVDTVDQLFPTDFIDRSFRPTGGPLFPTGG